MTEGYGNMTKAAAWPSFLHT